MKHSDTVILGGSCLAAGLVLNGAGNATVLERGAVIGGEYFDTYRMVTPMDQPLKSASVRALQEELQRRGALNDAYALAPLLYRALLPHSRQFKLWLEILEVKRVGNEWEVVFCDAGGIDTIRCTTLIDTTPNCRLFPAFARTFCTGQFLAAEIHTETPEAFLSWKESGLTFHRGRTADELFFTCEFPAGVSYPEMRRVLLQRWAERSGERKAGRIRSIAKQAGYHMALSAAELGENLYWMNPVRDANPLAALDHAELPLGNAPRHPMELPEAKCVVNFSGNASPSPELPLYSELKGERCIRTRRAVTFEFSTDLLVAGLGTGGSLAAVTAAEHGIAVAALEKLPLAGGTGTAGGVTAYYYDYPGGAFESIDAESNAIRAEHFEPNHKYNADAKGMVIESRILKNGGRILYETSVIGVWLDAEGKTVLGVRAATPEGVRDIGCRILIDATGNGDLSAMIGAEFREGREFDGRCQPFSSVRVTARGNGTAFSNFDAGYIRMSDPESITEGILSSNAQHTLSPQERQDPILWLTQIPGAREGRLPVCEHTITFHDAITHRASGFRTLAWAYSNFDDHSQDWAFADEETCKWMVVASLWGKRVTVPLPLEILLVKGFTNFITAGRAVSVDHTMASHLRMQRSIQKLGEIAALAAAQSIRTGRPLRELDPDLLEAEVRKSGTLDETQRIPESDPVGPDVIRELLSGETSGEAVWFAAQDPEQYAPLLRELVERGDEHTKRNAALALGLAGDDSVRPILREMMETHDPFRPNMTRNPRQNQPRNLAAIHLLGLFRNPSDAEFLYGILATFPEDVQIFSHTLRSLLKLGDDLPELRTDLRKRLNAIFDDRRFAYRLLLKNSSCSGEEIYHDLNADLRKMAEQHFRRWEKSEAESGRSGHDSGD